MSSIYARTKLSSLLLPILTAVAMIGYFIGLIYFLIINPAIPDIPLPSAVRYFIMPIAFAFPWILFVFIFRERTINSWETMKIKSNLIPLRWRMLYGFNTLIILTFFLFPFVSPPLAVFAALVLAYRLVHSSESIWEKSHGARLGYTLVLFILLSSVPIYLTFIWFQYYIFYVSALVLTTWFTYFDLMYFSSLCIVNALAVGALLHLSYGTLDPQGKLQFEKSQTVWTIRFVEFVIFIALWVLLNPFFHFGINFAGVDPIGLAGSLGFITYINYICLALIAIVYIVRYFVGVGGDMKLSMVGVLFAAAFLVVEVINSLFGATGTILRPILIVGASLIFIIAFLISFFTAPDELMTPEELISEDTSLLEEKLQDEETDSSVEEETNM